MTCGEADDREAQNETPEEEQDRLFGEPLEYELLDYLSELPEGLVDKLQASMQMHEDLMDKMSKRLEALQAKAISREIAPTKGVQPRARGAAAEAQDEWRKELRSQMARLRLAAEAHE